MSCMLTWPGSCGLVFLPHEERYDPLGLELPEMADAVLSVPLRITCDEILKRTASPGLETCCCFHLGV